MRIIALITRKTKRKKVGQIKENTKITQKNTEKRRKQKNHITFKRKKINLEKTKKKYRKKPRKTMITR